MTFSANKEIKDKEIINIGLMLCAKYFDLCLKINALNVVINTEGQK